MNTGEITFRQAIKAFLDCLQYEQHASPTTCRSYQSGLHRFLRHLTAQGKLQSNLWDVEV
jgi:site-specific recombinase XerD